MAPSPRLECATANILAAAADPCIESNTDAIIAASATALDDRHFSSSSRARDQSQRDACRSPERISQEVVRTFRTPRSAEASVSGPSFGDTKANHQNGARVRQLSAPGEYRQPHALRDRARPASVAPRAVSPFHARIASSCDALETEMARTREERSRRASKLQRFIADSKLPAHQSDRVRITQPKRDEAPRRMIVTQQLPAVPMEVPWSVVQGRVS